MSATRLPRADYNDRYTMYLPRLNSHTNVDQRGLMRFRPSNARHVQLFNKFGLYLFREQHYDFPVAWNPEDQSHIRAYFFLGGSLARTTVQPIGCAVFENILEPLRWRGAWCWIHPYERGRGHLSRAWPLFKEEFGDFELQHPVSFGMKSFLAKLVKNGEPATDAIRAALPVEEGSPKPQATQSADELAIP